MELTDRIIPKRGFTRRGPGSRPEVTDAELVCIAVAQVLLRFDDERHWLRIAPKLIGHLFPRLLGQSEYNTWLRAAAPLMEAALRWLADATPATAEMLRLMDATPVRCGQVRGHRPPFGPVRIRGVRVLSQPFALVLGQQADLDLHLRRDGHRFGLANPKLYGEREAARQRLSDRPANRPAPGTAVVTDKGLSGEETEEFFASDDLQLTLIRPARKDEKQPRPFPNWLRQRVEAIIWTLKNQLGLERHGGRVPAGLCARIIQRLLALNAVIWHNWMVGASVKRSLIAYENVDIARNSTLYATVRLWGTYHELCGTTLGFPFDLAIGLAVGHGGFSCPVQLLTRSTVGATIPSYGPISPRSHGPSLLRVIGSVAPRPPSHRPAR